MSADDLTPLDEESLAVLSQLKPILPVPDAARDRIWTAVAARAALVPGAPSSPASSGAAGLTGWIRRHPWWAVGGALALGVGGGAASGGRSRVEVVTVERPVATPAPVSRSPASAWVEVPPSAPSSRPNPQSRPPVASESPVDTSGQHLAAESAILDVARAALARGEPDQALVAVERHTSSFPRGVLREEREALAVKALVLAGRGEEARARAAAFRTRYPESFFLPAIESSLRTLP
jgi:hypothetical protein